MSEKILFEIDLSYIQKDLILSLSNKDNKFEKKDDFEENNEAKYQIVEGNYYEYKFSNKNYYFKQVGLIVTPSAFSKHKGRISPNTYVGTLSIPIYKHEKEVGVLELEVKSIKTSYREDYRSMLEFITEKSTDLLLQVNSPVSHSFTPNYDLDNETLYQRFAFVKSIIHSEDFKYAVQKVISSPVSKWIEISELTDIRKIKRFGNREVRQLIGSNNRIKLNETHPLYKKDILESLASKIYSNKKQESIDTPENRFIKHALETFLKFCFDIETIAMKKIEESKSKIESRLLKEVKVVIYELENYLQDNFFRKISRPITLKLNSPVLQKKEGYRQILKAWLMFDLAAKLIWKGGDDVYGAGKKNIATLYEYWLFFILLDLLKEIFKIKPKDINKLIESTKDGLGLKLKEGKYTALRGTYKGKRELNIRFNYNRTFKRTNYPNSGSWTLNLRPDYTLSIWPKGLTEYIAEREEEIVHIHFDAKYKVKNIIPKEKKILEDINNELDEEKKENRRGSYKNVDILKMHAYKDAIRRTGGAYVLYPGDESEELIGFHEILPGLGAFSIKPKKENIGTENLKRFINKVVEHFENRASQRENIASKSYKIHKNTKLNKLNKKIPEYFEDKKLIPDDTLVLIGYYKDNTHYKWIKENGRYNIRTGIGKRDGEVPLTSNILKAKYILLYTDKKELSSLLWQVIEESPQVYSEIDMKDKNYNNPRGNYIVFKIKEISFKKDGFEEGIKWDISNLKKEKKSQKPFIITLTELLLSSEI